MRRKRRDITLPKWSQNKKKKEESKWRFQLDLIVINNSFFLFLLLLHSSSPHFTFSLRSYKTKNTHPEPPNKGLNQWFIKGGSERGGGHSRIMQT